MPGMRGPIIVSAAVTASAGLFAAVYLYWRRKRIPTQWRYAGVLEKIFSTPMKSGYLTEHDEMECHAEGLRKGRYRDRSFMVVNSDGKFVTGRTHPLLTQVKCEVSENEAVFSFVLKDGMPELRIVFKEIENKKRKRVRYSWDFKFWLKVVDCGQEASDWLRSCVVQPQHLQSSNKAASSLRLVYLVDDSRRDDRGLFCDKTSFMLLTQKSLEDLNDKLKDPVSIRNFRPNILVSQTSKPFEEDNWKWVRIGDVVFEFLEPCFRCTFTTVNADTGEKNSAMEPLKTLKTYRQTEDVALRRQNGDAPMFGSHYGLRSSPGGVIRTGDLVYVGVD